MAPENKKRDAKIVWRVHLFKSLKNFIQVFIDKLIGINDSPQKVAIGFGLGVFLGILPGAGPVAALALAVLFHVNRAAAMAGSLLTNTWLSVVTFLAALKVGCLVIGADLSLIQSQYQALKEDFHWKNIFDAGIRSIFVPIFVGYLIIAIVLGLMSYGVVLLILNLRRQKSQ